LSKTLSQILNRPCEVDPVITGVTADSRKVREGFLFAALPGSKADGRELHPRAPSPRALPPSWPRTM
jgi:UDP-N-acetylmuramoyl-L-alanyl-D-glutamate--2,6-diaminopimelate ligase